MLRKLRPKAKVLKAFRLSEKHIEVLLFLTEALSEDDGTNYSQGQIVERALVTLFREYTGHDPE